MHYLTTKEASAILGCGRKNVTLLCAAGKFPGAKKVPGKKIDGEWRIPAEEVIQYQAQKEVGVEVLPPESYTPVTVKSLMDIIAEERERNDEAIEEIRKNIEERYTFYTEELQRKEEEIQELRGRIIKQEEESSETRKEVAAVWGKVEEMEKTKKKRPFWRWWF
jgi:hypothetical protein